MKKISLLFLVSSFLLLILASPALAATTWYVSPEGSDSNIGSDQNYPFKTINHAMTSAESGDQIHVKQGIYSLTALGTGQINLTPGVYLRGGYDNSWYQTGGPSTTIISGEGSVCCMSGFYLSSTTTIEYFTIQNGYGGVYGAGLYLKFSSPTITNCAFTSNRVNFGGGAGICNDSSSPTIINCTFTSNSTGSDGGGGAGIYNYGGSPTIINCTFTSNSAVAGNGGGIFNKSSSPTIKNCTFTLNSASSYGGGIYNEGSSSPTIESCTFTSNSATSYGGGIDNHGSSPTITNCTFTSNSASSGGGISNISSSSPTIINSIIYHQTSGGSIYNYNSTPIVNYSCIDDSSYIGNGNIINVDPKFVDGVYLQVGSPCIDAGTGEASALGLDYLQHYGTNPDSIHGDSGRVDMGYHYYNSGYTEAAPAIWYVDASVGGPGSGTQLDPFKTINSAEAAAVSGNEIHVKKGTYLLTATITLTSEVYLRGGYSDDWTTIGTPGATVIDGGNSVRCMQGDGLSSATTIENFTIQKGSVAYDYGGGLYLANNSFPTIKNCTFTSNSASGTGLNMVYGGGGIYNTTSSPTITNCTFTLNIASYGGGGIYNESSFPTITNCTFTLNSALMGGGIYNKSSSPTILNCTFTSNSSANGGGINNYPSSSPTITNCTFTSNSGGNFGGGINNHTSSSPTITNCTFTSNSATYGGGIRNYYSSSPTIKNSIIYYQTSGVSIYNVSSAPIVTYSCIQGGWEGTGNISVEPLFVSAEAGNVHLYTNSPCVNAGTGLASTEGLGYQQHYGTNPDGIHGDSGIVDMGYHYQSSGYTLEAVPTYTTKVGSAESWEWKTPVTEDMVPSGSPESWQWQPWVHNSGRKVPQGTAPSWTWGNE